MTNDFIVGYIYNHIETYLNTCKAAQRDSFHFENFIRIPINWLQSSFITAANSTSPYYSPLESIEVTTARRNLYERVYPEITKVLKETFKVTKVLLDDIIDGPYIKIYYDIHKVLVKQMTLSELESLLGYSIEIITE